MSKEYAVKSHPLPPPYTDFTSPPHEDYVLPFLQKHGNKLIALFAITFLLFAVTLVWQIRLNARSEAEYIAAERAFSALQALPAGQEHIQDNADYQKLIAILGRYPELASHYNGQLAQTLMRVGNVPLAMTYADKALQGLSAEHLPFYEEYAKSSLLITQGLDKEAYKRAVMLQKRMEELTAARADSSPTEFGKVLLFLNRLRLATLAEKLQMPQEAFLAWTAVNAEARSAQDMLLKNLLINWRSGDLSFARYLETQKAAQKGI